MPACWVPAPVACLARCLVLAPEGPSIPLVQKDYASVRLNRWLCSLLLFSVHLPVDLSAEGESTLKGFFPDFTSALFMLQMGPD